MSTVSEIRSKVSDLIKQNDCSEALLELLSGEGSLIGQEDYLWDYKLNIGISEVKKGSVQYKYKLSGVVRHIAAFHNTFGGYLIYGIEDETGIVKGCEDIFPFDDIKSRLKSDLRIDIDITVKNLNFNDHRIVLLHIPKRQEGGLPKAFERDSKSIDGKKYVYQQGDIYHRDGKGSVPATGDALTRLVAGKMSVAGIASNHSVAKLTQYNLPPRNYRKEEFVGRHQYLDHLWKWLLDPFIPIQLITGIGGLGKTTLARYFVEDVSTHSPGGYQAIIWYSAKISQYDPDTESYIETPIDDPNFFASPDELYMKLLLNLGTPEEQIPSDATTRELLNLLNQSLNEFPAIIVIDDMDSLSSSDQAQIFQDINTVLNRCSVQSEQPSRCLFTARELIGAAPNQVIKLQGFNDSEFHVLVEKLFKKFDLTDVPKKSSTLFKKFLRASGGSPLFAAAIARITHNGHALDVAINLFSGKDGNDARSFAFKRELKRLSPSQLRCLYGLIKISPCSRLELSQALELTEIELLDDLKNLRNFHLVERDDLQSSSGREYSLEPYIKLLADQVAAQLADPNRIEKRCREIRQGTKSKEEDVAKIIGEVLALWRAERHDEALGFILKTRRLKPEAAFTPDLKCILGRAYLRVEPCNWKEAERHLREAYNENCKRPELYQLWIEALEIGEDWNSLIGVAKQAINDTSQTKYCANLSTAYHQKADSMIKANNLQGAIDLLKDGGVELNRPFKDYNIYISDKNSLIAMRNNLFRNAIQCAQGLYRTSNDKVFLWELVNLAFEHYYRSSTFIRVGVEAAEIWLKNKITFSAQPLGQDLRKLNEIITKISTMHDAMLSNNWDDAALVTQIAQTLERMIDIRDRWGDE